MRLLLPASVALLLLVAFGSSVLSISGSQGSVYWFAEDTKTKGDWLFNPVGSPIGRYGSCGHILPNSPKTGTEIPMGNFSVPIGGYGNLPNPPYNWTVDQTNGIPFYKANPPYWDEYVPDDSGVMYHVNGTRFIPPTGGVVQYPGFEYAWADFHASQTDPREVWYNTTIPSIGGPGWRLASWDDGGERCQPTHGYLNFTLAFPKQGRYLLSLYAYDYERFSRWSEEYRIYNKTDMTLLATKEINGTVFDEGVYESFMVNVPAGGLTILVQVYNDAGHVAEPFPPDRTNNVVLSGIFVDCYQPVGGEVAAMNPYKMLIPMTILAIMTLAPLLAYVCINKRRMKQRPIGT